MLAEHLLKAPVRKRGRYFEEFEPGRVFEHHWGRTVDYYDSVQFTLATVHHNPLYFNKEVAARAGHAQVPVNPYFVFCTVLGLSVEDLSEMGGAFLGLEQLIFHAPVYPGDTLQARSTVLSRRMSSKDPSFGIVTWHTEGLNQSGAKVLEYRRSNTVPVKGTSV